MSVAAWAAVFGCLAILALIAVIIRIRSDAGKDDHPTVDLDFEP